MKLPEKLSLPERFQFRHKSSKAFTHTATIKDGRVSVKWSRGWHESRVGEGDEEYDSIWSTVDASYAVGWLKDGTWTVVEDKKVEQGLPAAFYFKVNYGRSPEYKAVVAAGYVKVTWEHCPCEKPATYDIETVSKLVKRGQWVIPQKKNLTTEQLRSNAEVKEQISALEHNVKLRKQDAEHAEILIANYEGRIKDLQSKLVKES